MKNKRKRALCLLLALLCAFQLLTAFCVTAFAEGETETSSNVLDDLHRDEDFDEAAYPDNPDDLSLQVITIAESTTWELLVYVYQPAAATQPLTASSINISQSHDAIQFKNYTLTLLSQEGVFQKYKVDNFIVEGASVRYYEITNIYRAPLNDSEQSTGYDDGNVVNELSNPVGKGFQFIGRGENVSLVVEDIDFISVTDKYVGFMRYPAGAVSWIYEGEYDVHFIAFSTNRKIGQLLEADVYYVSQFVESGFNAPKEEHSYKYGSRESQYSYLKFDERMKFTTDAWLSLEYEWNTIEKSDAFLTSSDVTKIYSCGVLDSVTESEVTEEAKQHISSKEWVLRFAHTYSDWCKMGGHSSTIAKCGEKTIVGEVSILRLKFETAGVIYNLGVVDNKQTGSDEPDNTYGQTTVINEERFEKLMSILLLIVIVVLISPILSPLVVLLVKAVGSAIKTIFSLFLWPFKQLFRKK